MPFFNFFFFKSKTVSFFFPIKKTLPHEESQSPEKNTKNQYVQALELKSSSPAMGCSPPPHGEKNGGNQSYFVFECFAFVLLCGLSIARALSGHYRGSGGEK
jgi:hypothetical protein